MKIEHLDGEGLRRAVVAGSDWVRHTRRHLNRINVFPVADGDTGTNMALSLSATAQAVREGTDRHLGSVLQDLARASVLGAKGNSGLILAHWFQGLAEEIGQRKHITSQELAAALQRASRTVDGALENPVEGTIITIMRATAEAAQQAARKGADITAMVGHMLEGAEASLRRTPEMLEVLRQAEVVDAGAQGFVNFLHGVQRSIRGLPTPDFDDQVHEDEEELLPGHDGEIDGRFCTELVVRGRRLDSKRLREKLSPLGSSLLVATTGELAKIHIHTDSPESVFQLMTGVGSIEERKVDDMLRQREERSAARIEPLVPLATQPSTVAIVADSAHDIPLDLRQQYGIEVVPLQVLFGDEVFRDGVDLDHAGFYERLERGDHFPTTSQPTPRAFVEGLERVREDRTAIVCTVGSGLSGTWQSARTAARLARQPRVEVFDTASASLGSGLLALCAARLAATGRPAAEILEWMEAWRAGTGVYFYPQTLEYLRRGGRIGRARSMLGNMLGLRPIFSYHGDGVEVAARTRGEGQAPERILQQMQQRIPAGARLRVGLGATTEGPLEEVEALLRREFEVVEVVRNTLTGVIGAHIGPGGWGVFYSIVPEGDPLL